MADRNVDLGNHKGVALSQAFDDAAGTGAGMKPLVTVGAGTNIVGKVGIDQTTDGTTNRVNPQGTLSLDQTVSFAHGQFLSPAVDLAGKVLCGFIVPSGWRSTATAITFQMSPDNSRWFNLYDNLGTEISATVAPSRCIRVNPSEWAGLRYLKFRSGTSASGIIQQNNEDILTLMTRSM